MNETSKKSTIEEYQKLIKYLSSQRGFDEETVPEKFMLLLEEAGEFAKAARKSSGIKVDEKSAKFDLQDEAADVLYVLIDLCNKLEIDLSAAFHKKLDKDNSRNWS